MASSGEEKGSLGRSGSRPRRVSTAGDAAHDETSRYVIGNHGTSPDKSTLADGDAAENHRSRADGSAPAYDVPSQLHVRCDDRKRRLVHHVLPLNRRTGWERVFPSTRDCAPSPPASRGRVDPTSLPSVVLVASRYTQPLHQEGQPAPHAPTAPEPTCHRPCTRSASGGAPLDLVAIVGLHYRRPS